jgi:ABC-type cobalt transport system substrate-binding protein
MGNIYDKVFWCVKPIYTPNKEKIESIIFPAPRAEGNLKYFIDNYRNIKLVTVDYH